MSFAVVLELGIILQFSPFIYNVPALVEYHQLGPASIVALEKVSFALKIV